MLRRLRHDLIDRVLRFPIPRFRRVKSPEIATMIKDEVEPLGPFIADSYVQPLYLGGQALTALIFIVVQDLWLGLMAAGIVALQTLIIPKLRRRLIVLAKERQLAARELAGRVGEIVDGINTIPRQRHLALRARRHQRAARPDLLDSLPKSISGSFW